MIGVRMVGACEMPEPDGSESKGAVSRRAESRGTDSESAWSGCPESEPWHGSAGEGRTERAESGRRWTRTCGLRACAPSQHRDSACRVFQLSQCVCRERQRSEWQEWESGCAHCDALEPAQVDYD